MTTEANAAGAIAGPGTLARIAARTWTIPAALLAAMVASALVAPWISPQNPYDLTSVRLENSYVPPVWMPRTTGAETPAGLLFALGADRNGRDVFSAVVYGLRVSLFVGFCGTLVAMTLGVGLGLVAGYRGGRLDAFVMRAADVQLSFPSILIALFMMAVWGPGIGKIVVAVGLVHWVVYARVIRGAALAEREKDYVAAIRSLGGRTPRILFRHLLPNLAGPIFVVSAVQFASIVMLEATLSYLGLGAPETRPSLGMLIKFGYEDFFSGFWWVWFFPGLALVLLILSINWLADLMRYRFAVGDHA